MADKPDYVPKWRPRIEDEGHFPPRRRVPPPPEGQDFFTLTAEHGRPTGVFEHGRELPYRGDQPS